VRQAALVYERRVETHKRELFESLGSAAPGSSPPETVLEIGIGTVRFGDSAHLLLMHVWLFALIY
jgi:hypothetical protein